MEDHEIIIVDRHRKDHYLKALAQIVDSDSPEEWIISDDEKVLAQIHFSHKTRPAIQSIENISKFIARQIVMAGVIGGHNVLICTSNVDKMKDDVSTIIKISKNGQYKQFNYKITTYEK